MFSLTLDILHQDPYIQIMFDGKVVGKSNIVMDNLNPVWEPFVVSVAAAGGLFHRQAPLVQYNKCTAVVDADWCIALH
jgi:hypothetical protein